MERRKESRPTLAARPSAIRPVMHRLSTATGRAPGRAPEGSLFVPLFGDIADMSRLSPWRSRELALFVSLLVRATSLALDVVEVASRLMPHRATDECSSASCALRVVLRSGTWSLASDELPAGPSSWSSKDRSPSERGGVDGDVDAEIGHADSDAIGEREFASDVTEDSLWRRLWPIPPIVARLHS
jgi:hypothetical protein